MTDAGRAYLKGLGNPEGHHALVCEYVGTHVARLFGLKTLDAALIEIRPCDEIPLRNGARVGPGPAFVTREIEGHVSWSGKAEQLEAVENTRDLAKLVVFDTWLRNIDRCPPAGSARHPNYDNVLLAPITGASGSYSLYAIDHTHCISQGREIGAWLGGIDCVKDEKVYGMFKQFEKFITKPMIDRVLEELGSLDRGEFRRVVDSVPVEWAFNSDTREVVFNFICDRAAYMADNIVGLLGPACWPQGRLWEE